MNQQSVETPDASNRSFLSRWIVLIVVGAGLLAAIGTGLWLLNEYQETATAYAWIQQANDGAADQGGDMICENSPAISYGRMFYFRYGKDIQLTSTDFEEEGTRVRVKGRLDVAGNESDYEAVLHINRGEGGFFGLLGCVTRIEQLQPDILPPPRIFGG
jgi:hypothetical protein